MMKAYSYGVLSPQNSTEMQTVIVHLWFVLLHSIDKEFVPFSSQDKLLLVVLLVYNIADFVGGSGVGYCLIICRQ